MSIQLCIVILYIILLFAISFYVKRRASQNPTQYLFAGRQFSAGLVAVSITGMAVGAASTVGVAESATKIGLAAGCTMRPGLSAPSSWVSSLPASIVP